MKVYKKVDVKHFFDEHDFMEATIIEFRYIEDLRQFILVVEFVNWELKIGRKEFKKITFRDVDSLTRLWSDVDTYKHIGFHYSIRDHDGVFPIQDIRTETRGSYLFTITIKSSHQFGGVELEAAAFECESRIGYAKQIERTVEILRHETLKNLSP